MKQIKIPNGCCELVMVGNEPRKNCIKVNRTLMERTNGKLPKKNIMVNVLMGSGFDYNGEIYHKDTQYVYIYLY